MYHYEGKLVGVYDKCRTEGDIIEMIKTGNKLFALPCHCGHDCSKCVIYIATQTNNDDLRRQAQSLYKENFGIDIPLEKFYCSGAGSKNVFDACKECQSKKNCIENETLKEFIVECANESDKSGINKLCSDCMLGGYEADYASDYYFDDGLDTVFVIKRDDTVVGCLMAEAYSDWEGAGSVLFLYNFCVDKKHRGQGMGEALLRSAVLYAEKLSLSGVYADLDMVDPAAVKVFQKVGFIPEEEESTRYLRQIL